MKKRILSLTVLVTLLTVLFTITPVSYAAGANLLTNSGFENEEIAPWRAHTGQFADKTDVTHSGNGAIVSTSNGIIYDETISCEGNKSYLFSAWVRSDVSDKRISASLRNLKATQKINDVWCDENGNPVDYWILDGSSFMGRLKKDEWTLIETVVNTPTDASEMKLEFSSYDAGTDWLQTKAETYYVDDVYFGDIIPSGVISGKEKILSGLYPVSEKYSMTVGNSQGGTAGISATDIVVNSVAVDSASLEKGVTFENGVLTVPTSYEDYTITLTADISGKVNGAAEASDFVKTKEIEVIGFNPYLNMLENGDFEEGNTGNWTGGLEIKEYAEGGDNGKYYAYGSEFYYLGINDFPKDNGKYYILNADFNPCSEDSGEKDIKVGFGTFASHNETFIKKTFSGDNWYNAQVVAKRESYENGDGVYLKPEISISVWDVGAWTMNNGYKAAFDNLSLCELNAIAEIGGKSVLNASITDITSQYSVDVKNNFGTTVGIGATIAKWSLKEAYEGVSIDENTGVLTVAPTIESGEITIVCEAESVIQTTYSNGAIDTEDKLKTTAEKTVSVVAYDKFANILVNPSFEEGAENWNPYEGYEIITNDVVTGEKSYCLSGSMEQFVGVEPDTNYVFSYKYKPVTSVKMCPGIWGYTPDIEEMVSPNGKTNGKWIMNPSVDLKPSSEWETFEVGFKTESNAKNVLIRISAFTSSWKMDPNIKLYIDDITLKKAGDTAGSSKVSLKNYVKYECDIDFEASQNENYSVFLDGTGGSGILAKLQSGKITIGQNATYTDTPKGKYHIKAILDYNKNNSVITVTYPDGTKVQRASEAYFFGSTSAKRIEVVTPYKVENVSNIKCNVYDASDKPQKIFAGDINIYADNTLIEDWDNIPLTANKISLDFITPLLLKEELDSSIAVINKKNSSKSDVNKTVYENGVYTMNISSLEPDSVYMVTIDNAILNSENNCEYEFKTTKAVTAEITEIMYNGNRINSLSQVNKGTILNLKVDYSNVNGNEHGYQIIAVYYGKGQKIIDTEIVSTQINSKGTSENTVNCEFYVDDLKNAGEIKFYVWDSLNSLKPLSNSYSLR